MLDLFSDNVQIWKPKLPDAELYYISNFWSKKEADLLFNNLNDEIPWKHDPITVFGKKYLQPRLTSLHSINNQSYTVFLKEINQHLKRYQIYETELAQK